MHTIIIIRAVIRKKKFSHDDFMVWKRVRPSASLGALFCMFNIEFCIIEREKKKQTAAETTFLAISFYRIIKFLNNLIRIRHISCIYIYLNKYIYLLCAHRLGFCVYNMYILYTVRPGAKTPTRCGSSEDTSAGRTAIWPVVDRAITLHNL